MGDSGAFAFENGARYGRRQCYSQTGKRIRRIHW